MSTTTSPSRILQAIQALQGLDRRQGAALLADDLRHAPPSGERWRGAAMLARQIGEIDMSLEASRRLSCTAPITLERLLRHWGQLSEMGRADEALAAVERLPPTAKSHPSMLHFRGALAGEAGDFAGAEALYREALAQSPDQPQTWFALAMIKRFSDGDPDLAAMERLRPSFARADPAIYARFLYGLGKAYDDCGDLDRAFRYYDEGAALRRRAESFDAAAVARFADGLIRDFTPEAFATLVPSGERATRSLFVNGLPRSGTTLVEQIVTSHSAVADGAEINLLRAALIPTGDYDFAGAAAYQRRDADRSDPWGDVARDYNRMIDMRFRSAGLIVDKTLSQSHFMGLLLHALPSARIIWMRRDPADTALSCYRSFFTSPIGWSWSLADIARYFEIEDRLHRHWTALFPDRILTVPYEELTQDPNQWIPRILGHFALPDEPQVRDFHRTKRNVRTASVQQVRAPISTNRIGAAGGYRQYMDEFHANYRA